MFGNLFSLLWLYFDLLKIKRLLLFRRRNYFNYSLRHLSKFFRNQQLLRFVPDRGEEARENCVFVLCDV